MRVRLLNLLLLAALLIAMSRLAQLLREPAPALPPMATQAPAPSEGPGAAEEPTAPPAATPESYDLIVARNLFSPTRGVVAPAPIAGAKPAAPPAPPPKLTLYGVVIVDGERTAFLQEGTQDARPKKVREKDRIGGAVVSAIRPDGVTVIFGGTEIAIPLRSPKDVPAAGAPGGTDAAAAARARVPQKIQRRAVPQAPVPGQMPMPGAPGQPAMPADQEPEAGGMPDFPADADMMDEAGAEQELLPEESVDGGEEPQMPVEEMME